MAFYTEHLGFSVDVTWPESEPTFAILCRDAASLGFFEPTEHQPGPIGYVELYIEVADVSALHDVLKTKVTIEWGPEVYAYGRREFAIRDADGYLIVFTEPTDDPPTTSEPEEGDG
jgi:catechol 2,3-dioxygenase-like lactoylglutathione lyase family enzyme